MNTNKNNRSSTEKSGFFIARKGLAGLVPSQKTSLSASEFFYFIKQNERFAVFQT